MGITDITVIKARKHIVPGCEKTDQKYENTKTVGFGNSSKNLTLIK